MANKLHAITLKTRHPSDHCMRELCDVFQLLIRNSGLCASAFAKRSKVQASNMSLYKKRIGPRALLRACENYYGWPVWPLQEITEFNGDFATVPTTAGIYVFYDSSGNVIYLGKAKNLRSEVRQTYKRRSTFHIRSGPNMKKVHCTFGSMTKCLSLYRIDNARIRKNFEAFLLRVFPNQSHNHNLGKFS